MARTMRDLKTSRKTKAANESKRAKRSKGAKGSQRIPKRRLPWLHAGLYKEPSGTTQNAWYTFRKTKRGMRIDFASNNKGARLGNHHVGRDKRYLITWDEQHRMKWAHHITPLGQWMDGHALKGRKVQRDTLLETCLNRNFIDMHPEGRAGAIGPALNVIHHPDGAIARDMEEVGQELCYPDTRIPMSTAHIKANAFKDVKDNPLAVIIDFINGKLSNRENVPNLRAFEKVQIDRAEAAFLEMGWRFDRQAAEQASADVKSGSANTIPASRSWRDHPPLWVDKYKGEGLGRLLEQHGRGGDDDNDSDDSDDPDNSDDERDDGLNGEGSSGSHDSESDDDDDDDEIDSESDSDDSDHDSDRGGRETSCGLFVTSNDRGAKTFDGKGKAKASKTRRGKGKQPSREQDEQPGRGFPYNKDRYQGFRILEDEGNDTDMDIFERELVARIDASLERDQVPPQGFCRKSPEFGEAGSSLWQGGSTRSHTISSNGSKSDHRTDFGIPGHRRSVEEDSDDEDNSASRRPASLCRPVLTNLRSLHFEIVNSNGAHPPTPEGTGSERSTGVRSPVNGLERKTETQPITPFLTPVRRTITPNDQKQASTGHNPKRASPIEVIDLEADDADIEMISPPQPEPEGTPEPVKEEPIIIKTEDNVVIEILDDEEVMALGIAKLAAAGVVGAGTGESPYEFDD